ncbi:hypothetical protein AJ79_00074 [Helicocarpus griseus UAMH5409]|uniref:Aminoglycoside phosphotransferase domain-containing protein n=1 Tax=Helicocarpus griseus UAMH5409 TaxID=1447875 RepID=A0A2B7YCX0_9EURO|nr:hypothetical protein AJ79_00074 [Helicocarpus griseus UAMH5409]
MKQIYCAVTRSSRLSTGVFFASNCRWLSLRTSALRNFHLVPIVQASQADSHPNRGLFSYTSGRFIYDEKLRFQERYVEFDIPALKEAVAEHASGHGPVVTFTKFSEGGFNRIFLATLEDGFRVIVKIPYHITVPKYYATASEAATLSFLKLNAYLFLRFTAGLGLDNKWFNMTKKQQLIVVTGVVDIEKKLFGIPFGSTGSLYFKKDIPPSMQSDLYFSGTPDPDGDFDMFCLGPIADYMSCCYKRTEWIEKYGKPLGKDFPYNVLFPGVISQDEYSRLLPNDPQNSGNQPTLRHPGKRDTDRILFKEIEQYYSKEDLTPPNIFINPDTFTITSIIDWQHTTITPLLLVAGEPRLFQNPDSEPPPTLDPPQPPEGYDSLEPAMRSQVDELLRRRRLYYLYRIFNGARNKLHLSACSDRLLSPRQHLVEHAGRQCSGNVMTLRGALLRMCEYWPLLSAAEGRSVWLVFQRRK